jgi:hypothetical protein
VFHEWIPISSAHVSFFFTYHGLDHLVCSDPELTFETMDRFRHFQDSLDGEIIPSQALSYKGQYQTENLEHLGVKRPGREADHSPPSSAEVKE